MGLAEEGVVDFLADTIEHGDVVVGVLGAAVTLDGLVALVADLVEVGQEVRLHHVVGIEDDHIVVVALDLLQGILHGLGLATLLENGLQEGNRQLSQLLVGLWLHVVGDDGHVETFIGIVLSQEGMYGVDDDAVFVVGRIEHEEGILSWLAHSTELSLQIGGER